MLARQSVSLGRAAAQKSPLAAPAAARNMATLRELELRLKSVRNIEKITKVILFYRNAFIPFLRLSLSLVDENDCFYEARKGTACHANREAVR